MVEGIESLGNNKKPNNWKKWAVLAIILFLVASLGFISFKAGNIYACAGGTVLNGKCVDPVNWGHGYIDGYEVVFPEARCKIYIESLAIKDVNNTNATG